MQDVRTLVITPTYVEAENIDEFLRRARAALPSPDILVVDDNSPDGTADIAEATADELGGIDVLRRPAKQGLGSAYRAGFAIRARQGLRGARPDRRRPLPRPRPLPNLLSEVESGVDLAIGRGTCPAARSALAVVPTGAVATATATPPSCSERSQGRHVGVPRVPRRHLEVDRLRHGAPRATAFR